MREILNKNTIEDFRDVAFVMEPDLLNLVGKALGTQLPETESHKRLLEEMAFRQGYGRHPGLSDAALDAMRSALSEHEQRSATLGGCV